MEVFKVNTITKNNYDSMIGKRKHTKQMSDLEATKIWNKIDNIKIWRLTYHAKQRLLDRNMLHINNKLDDLNKIIGNAKLIEYGISRKNSNGSYNEKVLLRTANTVDKKNNLVIALDITNGLIKSLWLNSPEDNHTSLDMSIYDENVLVIE